jgi:Flp pilus assembly protein TadG
MRRLRDDRGSVLAVTVVFIVVLLGVAALVIDVGSWFTAQRGLQSAADAATLAAAQDLPDTGAATSAATTYAAANVTGLDPWAPAFPSTSTVSISLSKSAPGFFSKFVGINAMTVHAHAKATVGVPAGVKYVAPIAVKNTAACAFTSTSCFGATKQLNFDESNLTSSKFGLVRLDCAGNTATSCSSSSTGSSQLIDWIDNGFGSTLSSHKWYAGVTGQKIGPLSSALSNAGNVGKMLLFPVFDNADQTAGAFHVIGFAAYIIDRGGVLNWKNDVPGCRPNCKLLSGHFVTYIAHGVDTDPAGTNFGVRVIGLTE